MKAVKILLSGLILFVMAISSANAQVRHSQKQRIKQGVKSGELTKRETKNILQDKKEIRQDIQLAKSDGKVTRNEKKLILKEQKRENREIYRKKHNNRDRN